MVEMLIIVAAIGLIAAFIGSMIALIIQHRTFKKTLLERQAWERAQESQQEMWRMSQAKRTLELEERLSSLVQQVRKDWHIWKSQDNKRIEQLTQEFKEATKQSILEKDIDHLPFIDETPLSLGMGNSKHPSKSSWQPPSFYRANLTGRDFSRRYLGHVDLRQANLVGTNFYMADLSGACLTGADLSQADLSGANLSGADLRNARMVNANLLVTDLHNTILVGANLLGAHNLTAQQLYASVCDSTTQFDQEIESSLPRATTNPQIDHKSAASSPPTENTATAVSAWPEAPAQTPDPFTDAAKPDAEPFDAALLTPLPLDDIQSDAKAANLPANTPENMRTEELNIASPNTKHNGRKSVKVD